MNTKDPCSLVAARVHSHRHMYVRYRAVGQRLGYHSSQVADAVRELGDGD